METILSYLENMFLHLPRTSEVLRAKEELATMMEDKYNELLAEGKQENEAVGIVISEFGNLEELSEELGLGDLEQTKETGEPVKRVSRGEAEEYISATLKSIRWIGLGVMLCIWSPIALMILGTLDESGMFMFTDAQYVCYGLVPLFVMIGIAVALFIYHGMRLECFEYLKKEPIEIDFSLEKQLRQMDEEERRSFTLKIIVGVMLCIFAVLQLLVIASIDQNGMAGGFSAAALLLIIGVAVCVMVSGSGKRECFKVLLQEGEFTEKGKKSSKIIDIVAGIYWPIVTVIYLAWSFTTMDWGFTWIVWPIAGALFGCTAAVVQAVTGGVES